MKSKITYLVGMLVMLMAASCSTPKDITYLQGLENNEVKSVIAANRIKLKADDRLRIGVSSKDKELSEVFNLQVSQGNTGGGNYLQTFYTVDKEGFINFPVLGQLHVAGLDRVQLQKYIENQLTTQNLLKDPVVIVEITNAEISVLGAVGSPGTVEIDRDEMTILQALGKAGDLQLTGKRKNVLLVRQEDGQDHAYRLDLTDTESLLQSPAYYVQQNDIVYVEPNDVSKRSTTSNGSSAFTPSFWISITSFLLTLGALFIW